MRMYVSLRMLSPKHSWPAVVAWAPEGLAVIEIEPIEPLLGLLLAQVREVLFQTIGPTEMRQRLQLFCLRSVTFQLSIRGQEERFLGSASGSLGQREQLEQQGARLTLLIGVPSWGPF